VRPVNTALVTLSLGLVPTSPDKVRSVSDAKGVRGRVRHPVGCMGPSCHHERSSSTVVPLAATCGNAATFWCFVKPPIQWILRTVSGDRDGGKAEVSHFVWRLIRSVVSHNDGD
jgi:hypothetical protein